MYSKQLLDLEEARTLADAVIVAASAAGGPVAVAVADADGWLVIFVAMDGVSAIPRQMAPRKARTAAVLQSDTTALASSNWAPSLVAVVGDPDLVLLPGGVVVRSTAGAVLGAVGVSGRSPSEDDRLAQVGAAALSS